jgi:hypothetical protein
MRTQLFVALLFILPIIFILNPGFSWERLSLEYIGKIGDRTSVRTKFEELGYLSEIAYENFR